MVSVWWLGGFWEWWLAVGRERGGLFMSQPDHAARAGTSSSIPPYYSYTVLAVAATLRMATEVQ